MRRGRICKAGVLSWDALQHGIDRTGNKLQHTPAEGFGISALSPFICAGNDGQLHREDAAELRLSHRQPDKARIGGPIG